MEHHIKSYSPCEKVHAAFEIKFQSFLYQKCKSFSVSHVFVQLEALYDIQILYIPPLLDRCCILVFLQNISFPNHPLVDER